MPSEIVKGQNKLTGGEAGELFSTYLIEEPDKTKAKHQQFLALLKKQYGYTNEKAVNELERLLKLFYTMNRSLGIHRTQTNIKHPHVDA